MFCFSMDNWSPYWWYIYNFIKFDFLHCYNTKESGIPLRFSMSAGYHYATVESSGEKDKTEMQLL